MVKLHLVIQAAFGWGHSHLHEFIAGDGERYGTPDPMYDDPGSITSESTRLTTALNRSTLSYVYDFGDYWDHRIKVEKKLAPDALLSLPFCVGGASATRRGLRRRPRLCRLRPGHGRPQDPEHENLAEWIGVETWDPHAFDSTAANDRLDAIKL